MREIKFRAWDSYQNKMYDWNEICEQDKTGALTLSNLLNGFIEHIKPEQFTGLTDKNGVDIYDGDVVKCNWNKKAGFDYTEVEIIKDRIQIQEVFYSKHFTGFGIAVDKQISEEKYKDIIYLTSYRAKTFIEIIGNIHETPNLLN